MAYKQVDNIVIEDAHIIFRNFAGEETKFNRAGNRNFCVVIDDPQTAQDLMNDGWNIRTLQPRDPEEEPRHYLQVKVKFGNIPPHVYLISGKTKTELDEESVSALDYADLKTCDLVIRAYNYDVNGKTGISAYLKKGYFVVDQDDLDRKYAEEESPEELPF